MPQAYNPIEQALTDDKPYTSVIVVIGTKTYVCTAAPGTAVGDAYWRIKLVNETDPNNVIISWADGNANFDNIQTAYATKVYS